MHMTKRAAPSVRSRAGRRVPRLNRIVSFATYLAGVVQDLTYP